MYETILTAVEGRVATITFNRPAQLNALNTQVMEEVLAAATAFSADPGIGCLVLTGNDRAFAAGADISELAVQDYADMQASNFFAGWDRFAALRLPKVAAVSRTLKPCHSRNTNTCRCLSDRYSRAISILFRS